MKKLLLSVLCLSSLFTATAAHEPLTLKELTLQTVLANFTAEQIKPCINGFDSVTTSKVLKKMQMAAILHYDFEKRDLAHPDNLGAKKVALFKEHGLWFDLSIQDFLDNPTTRHLCAVRKEQVFLMPRLALVHLFISSLDGLENISGASTVRTLVLAGNQLTTIAAGAFNCMPFLRDITLLCNPIAAINASAFNNLGWLNIVDLRHNRLTTVATQLCSLLAGLFQEQRLNAESSQGIVHGAFGALPRLTHSHFVNYQLTDADITNFNEHKKQVIRDSVRQGCGVIFE